MVRQEFSLAPSRGARDDPGTEGVATVGGPMLVEVTGFDRPNLVVCRYKLEVDLPKRVSVQAIQVPATAAIKPILVSPAAGGF